MDWLDKPIAWLRVPARICTDIFRGLPPILIGQGFAAISRQLFSPSNSSRAC